MCDTQAVIAEARTTKYEYRILKAYLSSKETYDVRKAAMVELKTKACSQIDWEKGIAWQVRGAFDKMVGEAPLAAGQESAPEAAAPPMKKQKKAKSAK